MLGWWNGPSTIFISGSVFVCSLVCIRINVLRIRSLWENLVANCLNTYVLLTALMDRNILAGDHLKIQCKTETEKCPFQVTSHCTWGIHSVFVVLIGFKVWQWSIASCRIWHDLGTFKTLISAAVVTKLEIPHFLKAELFKIFHKSCAVANICFGQ